VVLLSASGNEDAHGSAEAVAPARFIGMPSIAYRLALVAAGDATGAVSLNGPCSLDYAAGHALLRGAGCELLDGSGALVRYDEGGRGSVTSCYAGAPAIASALARRSWRLRSPGAQRSVWCKPVPGRACQDDEAFRRAQGVLLGQLAGDALGSLVEFKDAPEVRAAYPAGISAMDDGGVWDTIAGQPTDDSELALSLARTLEAGGFDEGKIACAYAAWLASHPFDVGTTTSRALSGARVALDRGLKPTAVANAARAAADEESKSNGALMRVSPLGVFGARFSEEDVITWARRDAALTHPNRVCQDASAVLVAAIRFAIATPDSGPQAIADHALDIARRLPCQKDVLQALEDARERRPAFAPHSGYVLIALQNAFFQLRHARSLEAGIVDTVMQGHDSDTNAAIAGALLGAAHGSQAVPLGWRNAVLSCRPIARLAGVRQPRPERFWPGDALILAERLLVG
jgi:ADP-ribosylglycohydrolase